MYQDQQEMKCVILIDEALPLGLIANTAAVLGTTLGKQYPKIVGGTVEDRSGQVHTGIVNIPLPILKSCREELHRLRALLYEPNYSDLTVVDFCDIAQVCKAYDDYTDKIAGVDSQNLNYLGLALCGRKKLVNQLTGSLPLLR